MAGKWWTLVVVCVATFMLLLDVTIVNVALPDIQRDLGSSFADLQWVIDAYTLTLASFLLTAGTLGDRFGHRPVFVTGLVIFTLSSLGCALSESPLTLTIARLCQGTGAAVMFATSLALLAGAFRGADRGTAFGVYGATTGVAVAVGPLVGGVLTESASWPWIFYINVPIGVAAVALTLSRVSPSPRRVTARFDLPGLVTLSLGLASLVWVLIQGNERGWSDPVIVGGFVVAGVLLLGFLIIEGTRTDAMFDLGLFRVRTFVGAGVAAFAMHSTIFATFLYLTLYLQNSLGYSPLQAGLRFLPLTALSFLAAAVTGPLIDKAPRRLVIGAGLALIGTSLLLLTMIDETSGWTVLIPGFVVGGIGVGMVNPALASTAIDVVEPTRAGMASGINSTFRQVGLATGIAALGAVYATVLRDRGVGEVFGPAAATPEARAAVVAALDTVLTIGAAGAFAGALAAVLLINATDQRRWAPDTMGVSPQEVG